MKRITWSAFSVKCLEEIRDFIATESGSREIADRYVSKIINRTDQLSRAPESGQEEDMLKSFDGDFRYLVEGNYKIIYENTLNGVFILDVFHTRQHPRKIRRSKKK
ncbi:MAG: plasmid stabilization system family protein [Bacteroidetes bacterium]|nr:MAG: plasmid stabilization system family protein [Bacteroidota bacterium]